MPPGLADVEYRAMKCAACDHENESDSTFCEECGGKLVALCGSCGSELKASARFCRKCGAPVSTEVPIAQPSVRRVVDYTPKHLADRILKSRSALEGERKQITVLFADLQGSMQLAAHLDPEAWHQLLEQYFAILTEAVHRLEGTVNQYTGDGIMALFGAPIAHEDHAQRACYAALQARDRLRAFGASLQLPQGLRFGCRIGLNSGEVVVGKIGDDLRMDYTAQGATVGIAQRVEQSAASGSVYLSNVTARLVAGFFHLEPKGVIPVSGGLGETPLFELEAPSGARTRLDVAVSRGLSQFVGRATEMELLQAALARTRSGHGQVIGIVGDAGLGKSRLCFEFVEHCRSLGLPVYKAHCPAHGRNIPYLPILELFRNYFGIDVDDDAARVREKIEHVLLPLDPGFAASLPVLFEFMGATDPNRPPPAMDAELKQRQLYELLHRVVRAQDAQGGVTVTLIDDLHWIDAGSDGFVYQLVSAVEGRRSLVVLNFRPEYEAAFSGKTHYQQLPLVPLDNSPLRELIENLIGCDESVIGLTGRMTDWTNGNPFYTEELVNSLVEAGNLVGSAGQYRLAVGLEHIAVPANVRAVLAARIDRLPDAAKRLLQTAAVIGKEFSDALLAAVTDLTPQELGPAIERLKTGDFVFERAIYPTFEYAFKHPLTHEVAYQSQLQTRRANMHAAVARAIEAQGGNRLDELAALLAHHWELAGDALNAARWHRRAAEWTGLSDLHAALHHWLRIRELLRSVDQDSESTALTVMACSRALSFGWRLGESDAPWAALFEEGCAAAERSGDLASLSILNGTYSTIFGLSRGSAEAYVGYAAKAVSIADRTTDAALQCAGRAFLLYALWYRGEMQGAERVYRELIALAGDDPNLGATIAGLSPLVAAFQTHAAITGFTRDPTLGLAEARRARQFALDHGYRDMAGWIAVVEGEILYASRNAEGIRAVAEDAMSLAKERGIGMEVMATGTLCNALALQGDWRTMLRMASDMLQRMRDSGSMGLWQPNFLAHIGRAQNGLGEFAAGRETGAEAVDFMRRSHCTLNPAGYAVLAAAQLALHEPSDAIARTLDEYEALLARTGLRIYEGELYELRAQLAERDGNRQAQAAALARAEQCHAHFRVQTDSGT